MSRIQLLTLCVSVTAVSGPAWSDQPAASCPTLLVAEFPTDDGGSLCVWELSDCTADPVASTGVVYADCAGDACNCVAGNACEVDGEEPDVEATEDIEVGDEVPEDEVPDGDEAADDPEAAVDAAVPSTQHIVTSLNILQQPPVRTKKLRSNRRNFPYRIPRARQLLPEQANEIIEAFGKGGRKVKYLKVLRLRTLDHQTEYYALFKVFNPAVNDPSGNGDQPSDYYLGVRMGEPAGRPPGGYAPVNVRTQPEKVRRLQPFAGGYVREAAVQVRIPPRGGNAPGTGPQKWFHLFGTVM